MGALTRALGVLRRFLTSNPGKLAAASRALGLGAGATAEKILAAAKDNPVATALVLLQAGEMGAEALEAVLEEHPEVRGIVDAASPVDNAEDYEGLGDMLKFRDEFATLRSAIAIMGGLERFLSVRRALSMSDQTVNMFLQFREMR